MVNKLINVNPFSLAKDVQAKYALLNQYYFNNDLYSRPSSLKLLADVPEYDVEAMKPLRTPVNRAVGFYMAKVANGNPKIITPTPQMGEAISKFLNWSNFEVNKKGEIQKAALLGMVFKKIVSSEDKVWQEIINPEDVTDFSVDTRGYITEIRIDTTVYVNDIKTTRTEYWTINNGGYMAIWEHGLGKGAKLESLDEPKIFAYLAEFGIDFIPIVLTRFKKSNKKYSEGCVEHVILKIDEANRMATRLHQLLFRYNKDEWAVLANSVDKDGRPMPAPKIKDAQGNIATQVDRNKTGILYLPGMADIKSLIPDIKYKDALEILQAQEKEITEDLPELLYYSLEDKQRSGVAVRTILASAIDRAVEFQSNFIQSQIRANMMALTIGSFLGIFPDFGSFDRGDLQHSMQFEEMFPVTADEKATALQKLPVEIPLANRMRLAGYTPEEIADATVGEVQVT